MKYIMLETDKGQKLPIIFPDALVHAHMAMLVTELVEVIMQSKSTVASAGSIGLGLDVTCTGSSSSLKIAANPHDAERIMLGEAISFMPDEMLPVFLTALQARR